MTDIRLSKSKILDYVRCPRMFYFKHCTAFGKKKQPASKEMERGSILHEIFEAWNTNRAKFDQYYNFVQHDNDYTKNIYGFFKLLREHNLDKAEYSELWIHDKELNIAGFVDAIYHRDDDIIVIDYKSGKFKENDMGDYLMELYIYEMLVNRHFGIMNEDDEGKRVTHIGMFFTAMPEKSFLIPVTKKDRNRCMKRANKYIAAIRNDEFNEAKNKCKWCNFQGICDDYKDAVVGELSDHVLMAV